MKIKDRIGQKKKTVEVLRKRDGGVGGLAGQAFVARFADRSGVRAMACYNFFNNIKPYPPCILCGIQYSSCQHVGADFGVFVSWLKLCVTNGENHSSCRGATTDVNASWPKRHLFTIPFNHQLPAPRPLMIDPFRSRKRRLCFLAMFELYCLFRSARSPVLLFSVRHGSCPAFNLLTSLLSFTSARKVRCACFAQLSFDIFFFPAIAVFLCGHVFSLRVKSLWLCRRITNVCKQPGLVTTSLTCS